MTDTKGISFRRADRGDGEAGNGGNERGEWE